MVKNIKIILNDIKIHQFGFYEAVITNYTS